MVCPSSYMLIRRFVDFDSHWTPHNLAQPSLPSLQWKRVEGISNTTPMCTSYSDQDVKCFFAPKDSLVDRTAGDLMRTWRQTRLDQDTAPTALLSP